jgi:5'-nucleotidase
MRVLVTNDDGWQAPGLAALAVALVAEGHDVVVAAPMDDRSGSGASIGPLHSGQAIEFEKVSIPGLGEEISCYGIDGPPALAVMAARLGAFGDPPELVASGVNPGPNTGRATLHSGTVGAALTAANFGVSAVAVSIETGERPHFDAAARVAALAVRWLGSAPNRTVLNINVPNRRVNDMGGVRLATLAPFGTVRAAIAESTDGRLQMELRDTRVELPEDSDTALVRAGVVAITPLVGIRAAPDVDVVAELAEGLRLSR